MLGQPLNAANRRSAARLRKVAELYPEIADAEAGEGSLPNCSATGALERQEPFINQVLATSALAMLARLFRYGVLTHRLSLLPCHGLQGFRRTASSSPLSKSSRGIAATHLCFPLGSTARLISVLSSPQRSRMFSCPQRNASDLHAGGLPAGDGDPRLDKRPHAETAEGVTIVPDS